MMTAIVTSSACSHLLCYHQNTILVLLGTSNLIRPQPSTPTPKIKVGQIGILRIITHIQFIKSSSHTILKLLMNEVP